MNLHQNEELKRKNIRLAWLFAAFALAIFITSFPYWKSIVRVLGEITK